ncbi:MAG: septal ring lytic transglycosylase RlpA family protein [Rhodobiaceae bacterium]|nr:septal ring lytic transglycosylase RlpA family protein [Rhodobiaceae bacterium]
MDNQKAIDTSCDAGQDVPALSRRKSSSRRRLSSVIGLLMSPLIAAGCAEAQLGAHVAKSLGQGTGGGVYKVGNPYKIDGQWYYPAEDENYDQKGIASWYGPNFHGKPTANGEVFDQNLVTAAHPTLPMPIYARVTNLENGRSLVVRINDRGPFAADREIDLSRRSAELLGFIKQGTTQVRVQYLRRAPLDGDVPDVQSVVAESGFTAPPRQQASDRDTVIAAPTEAVQVASLTPTYPASAAAGTLLPTDMAPIPDTPAQSAPAPSSNVAAPVLPGTYVQAGAFANQANAEALKIQLSDLGPVDVNPINVNGTELYRVRVGPLQDPQAANSMLQQITGRGHTNARVVIE